MLGQQRRKPEKPLTSRCKFKLNEMKKLKLENFEVQELDVLEVVKSNGGDSGYRPGITFGDSYWFGPSSGYIDGSGVHADRPPDWVDIYFGGASY